MPEKDKKDNRKTYIAPKTGEDIDMIHESEYEPEQSDSGSVSYKDDIDGA